MQQAGRGVIVYLRQEGRGIGLINKIRAYQLQDQGLDTVEANVALGLPVDARDFTLAKHIFDHLGVHSVKLLTNNPQKVQVLADAGYVCNALATPYGVGVELPLADLMLAVGAPQGSVAERANWLRSESRRLGRMLRDQNRQRVADNAGDDAYVALVEDFDHRRAGLLLQWLPIGHI